MTTCLTEMDGHRTPDTQRTQYHEEADEILTELSNTGESEIPEFNILANNSQTLSGDTIINRPFPRLLIFST